jgi:hypothetical protein
MLNAMQDAVHANILPLTTPWNYVTNAATVLVGQDRPGDQQQNDKCPPISVPWVSLSNYAYPSVETKLPQLVGSGNEKPAGKLGMPLGSVPMPKGNVEETPCPSWGRSR